MEIIKGTNRIAIVGKSFTVKIAHINPRAALSEAVGLIKAYWQDGMKLAKLRITLSEHQGPFRGVWANYREWSSSASLGDNVIPTRFSFLGIFNVMDTGTPCDIPRLTFLKEHPGRGDQHTFGEVSNYVWHGGRLKLCDYGNPAVIKYLLANGEQFRRELDVLSLRYTTGKAENVLNSKGGIFDEKALNDFFINLQKANPQGIYLVLRDLYSNFYSAWQVSTKSNRSRPEDGPKGERLERILALISFCSNYVEQLGRVFSGNNLIEIKCYSALIIGFIGWRFTDKVKEVLPMLAREFEDILNKKHEDYCEEVNLAINIAQAFNFIAEKDPSALKPFTNVLEIGAKYWEAHIQFISQDILSQLGKA